VDGFESGVVVLGSVYLEVVRIAPGRRLRVPLDRGAIAVALEPERVELAVAELARRSIPHGPPVPFLSPAPAGGGWLGEEPPLWSTVHLGGFLGDEVLAKRFSGSFMRSRLAPAGGRLVARLCTRGRVADVVFASTVTPTPWVFLCEYHNIDISAERARWQGLLRDAGGGRLGLRRVRELVIGVPEPKLEIDRWRRLLEPAHTAEPGRCVFPDGPAIRFEQSPRLSQRVICEVSSLDETAAFLRAEKMLDSSADSELQIAPATLAGLDLRLVQA